MKIVGGIATQIGRVDGDSKSFEIWMQAIESRTGVQITPDREKALMQLLQRRMQDLGHDDIEEYLSDALDAARGAEEWSGLVDSLLIKETSFFRHQPSMDFVRRRVMTLVRQGDLSGPLWVWSLGCSTGEESYSLAITVEQAMRAAGVEPNFGIIGTDISREAILQARRSIYRESKMVAVSGPMRKVYFEQVGDRLWRAKERLRRRVCFLTGNVLSDPDMLRHKVHLIYCQNMLVYFRRWKRREIVSNLTENLEPNGCLVLGLGELSDWVPQGFERAQPRSVQAYVRCEK